MKTPEKSSVRGRWFAGLASAGALAGLIAVNVPAQAHPGADGGAHPVKHGERHHGPEAMGQRMERMVERVFTKVGASEEQKARGKDINVLLLPDHGSVRVKDPSKCVGDRQTSTNIRYKLGKNLNFEEKDVFAERNPEEIQLPKSNLSSTYIFAKEDKYLIYPNNYSHFVQFFKNTFQHGGLSLEEMIIPVVTMSSK